MVESKERLILDDAEDALRRCVLRCELNVDGDRVLIDFAKRYAGHEVHVTKFTEPTRVRSLDKESLIYLRTWIDEVLEVME